MATMYTTAQAAAQLGRSHRVIKAICAQHGIGTLLTPRIRLLTSTDIYRLRKLADSRHRGRPARQTTK